MFWENYPLWLQYFSVGSFMFASGVLMFRLPLAPFIILTIFSWLGLVDSDIIGSYTKCNVWTIIWHTLFIISPFFIIRDHAKQSIDTPFNKAFGHSLWNMFVIFPVTIIFLIAFAFSFLFAVGKWRASYYFFPNGLNVIVVICLLVGTLFGFLTLKMTLAYRKLGLHSSKGSTIFMKGLSFILRTALACMLIIALLLSTVEWLSIAGICLAVHIFYYMFIDGIKQLLRVKKGVVEDWAVDKTHLHIACKEGDVEKVKQLLSKGVNVNAIDDIGETPLRLAINSDNFNKEKIVKLLIDAGADVNMTAGKLEESAFFVSCLPTRSFTIFKQLLDAGADVNKVSKHGWAPMIVVREIDKARALIEAGADVNIVARGGNTPIMAAASRLCGIEILEEYIKAGADVNKANDAGKTALIKAVEEESLSKVRALIEAGADVNHKDKDGKTALDYAEQKKHNEIINFLKEHGAK